MKKHQKYLYKFRNCCFSAVLKKEWYASNLENPTTQLESRLMLRDGLKEKVSVGLVSWKSNVSCGFVWVCSLSVAHFLVVEIIKASVLFLGHIMSRFILNIKI